LESFKRGVGAMASDWEFVKFVCDQLCGAGEISSRRMFGEAAVYLGDKVIGLICANQLFVKPTEPGRAKIGAPIEAPPFPGATNWFLMADLDDPEFLADLVRTTAAALPSPKVKTKKTLRAKSSSSSGPGR
jgi:TfoX/Sxy family transcriptional regulator of competence genes